jgi:ankyrin repeat protein
MQLLVEKGANINPPVCSQGKTLLYVATKAVCTTNCQGDEYTAFLEAVLKLIKAGADVNLAATGGSSPGCTPLLMTARHGNVAVMRALLDAGATVDAANNSSETPLFLASSRGNVEQARMLLEKGADIDRPNDKQATPLYIAAQNGHVEVMQLLVEKGANINPPVCSEGKTLLYVATEGACKGTDDEATMIVYVELLDILIKGADDIDQAATGNNNGCNPLLMTAGYGNVAMMRALLDAGATVDRALNSGETSLFRASSGGNVEQVRMLLEKGADIDRPNETLTTPLYIAAQNGHLEAMRLLVERGLSDAAAAGYDQITGIDNAPDGTNGKTPLYAALERGHMEVGKLLIERGGADTTVTVKGQSLEQASTKMEIVVMLRLTERDRDLAVIAAALSTDTAAVADEIKRDDEVAEAEKDAKKAEEEAKAAGAAAAGAAAGGSAPAPAPPMSTPSSASAEAEAKTDQEVADDMDDEEDEDYNPDEDDEEDEEGDSDSDSADYLPEVVVARQQGNFSELESVSLQGVDGDTDQTAYEAGILAAGRGSTSMDPGSAPAPTPPTSPPPSASAGRGRPSHTRSRKSDGTFCAAAPVTRRARRMSPGAGTTDVPAVPDAATLANRKVLKEATLRRRERQREDAFLEEQYQYYTLADGRQTQQVGNYWAQTVAGVEAASPANEFRPTHWYLSRQRDINSKMRAILFDWMTEVIQRTRYFDTNKLKRRDSERLALHPVQRVEETNVLHLSVNLTDRYLTRVVMKRLKLQLVGVVAMKIAFNALMDDMCAWDVYDWMNITDNAYSRSEVVEMEFQMLTTLEYNVFDGLEKFRPSPDADPWAQKPYYLPFSIPAYLHQYLLAVNAVDTTLGTLAHYYAEKSIHKSEICLAHPPQHIAAAALFAASILQCQMPSHFETAAPFHWKKQPVTRVLLRKCWTETHQEVTGLTVNPGDASLSNVLVELASEMVRFVDKTTVTASKRTLDACKKRYGDYSRLGQDVIKGVSGMPIPDLSSLVAWASLMRQERP